MISQELVKSIHTYIKERPKDERAPGNHPSEIASDYRCPRREVIKLIMQDCELDPAEPTNVVSEGNFDAGHAIHHWFQNKVLGPMGILNGKWICGHCSATILGFLPKSCPLCDQTVRGFGFVEQNIEIPEHNIVGHIDGVLDIEGRLVLLDIKSHKSSTFTGLKEPKQGHIGQVMIYMKALGLTKAVVLYVQKDNWYNLKAFEVDFDEITYRRLILEGITEIQQHFDNNSIPNMHPKCSDGSWWRKACWVQGLCLGCRKGQDVRDRIKAGIMP